MSFKIECRQVQSNCGCRIIWGKRNRPLEQVGRDSHDVVEWSGRSGEGGLDPDYS